MAAALVLIGHSPVVSASYYKCVDQQGHVGYSDKPCAADQSHHLITKNARVITTYDCRIAYNFATDSSARWQRREPLDSIFSYYQANNQLSDAARQIAEFIYSFDAELQNSSRVLALMMKSCESGDFGDNVSNCDAFPKAFIDSLGGCKKARHTHPDVLLRPEFQEAASASPSDRVSIRMAALQFRK
ncbi:MAG: DUF4124 domain-containing protein [Granulosicoccus sp.]